MAGAERTFHSLKLARVAEFLLRNGPASQGMHPCVASYWPDGIPNAVCLRLWRRELALEVYSVSYF
jgi:hypothetical protein